MTISGDVRDVSCSGYLQTLHRPDKGRGANDVTRVYSDLILIRAWQRCTDVGALGATRTGI